MQVGPVMTGEGLAAVFNIVSSYRHSL